MDLVDLNDDGPKNNKGYRYILVKTDKFSKFGSTVPLKKISNKKRPFENILESGKVIPKSIYTDDGNQFLSEISTDLSKRNNKGRENRYSSEGCSIRWKI